MTMALKQHIIVDARFKSCPGPLISLIEAVKKAGPGTVIKLLATDPASPMDVKEWTRSTSHKLLEVKEKEGFYEIYVEVAGDGLG